MWSSFFSTGDRMRCLIRTRRARGKFEDIEVRTELLRIGRWPDQDIRLRSRRVGLSHAALSRKSDGVFFVQSMSPTGVLHNGERVFSANLQRDDVIEVGGARLTIRGPEGVFDLCVEVDEPRELHERELEKALHSRSQPDTEGTGRSIRKASRRMMVGILAIFLLIPLLGFAIKPVGEWLRRVPVLSDLSWKSGPTVPAHRQFEKNCNTCHEKAFVSVENSACTSCHKNTAHHLEAGFRGPRHFDKSRCSACHKEHNGKQAFIPNDDSICTACHANIKAKAPVSHVADVKGFSSGHPEFRATLLRSEGGNEKIERVSLANKEQLAEHSNLEFSHEGHLKTAGIRHPTRGKVQLACGDCHTPEPGGEAMVAIDFETHCHDCHQLTFEKDEPERELPHGDEASLLGFLEGYYADRALRGRYRESFVPLAVRDRHRPGEEMSVAEQLEALEWAGEHSREVGRELVGYRVCATCHAVRRASRVESALPLVWQVEPVRVATRWFPHARFNHDKHKTEKCTDCHEAAKSKDSRDVLLKGIATCRTCHGGEDSSGRVASACIDCHGFHVSKSRTMVVPVVVSRSAARAARLSDAGS
jgi:FHA domain